jgi:uncharacterized membrane protein YhaH (DUF805 family)
VRVRTGEAIVFIFGSVLQTLRKYADFKGRASRQEFWCFVAFLIIVQAVCGFLGLLFGLGPSLWGLLGALLIVPQLAVAVRRLHDLGKSGRELLIPCVILLALPLAFAFRGILPKVIALGVLAITLLAFANLLTLFLKKGTNVPNRYGAAPTAFSFAR